MKKILLALSFPLFISSSWSQYEFQQFFDGADTSVSNSVIIIPDTSSGNIWQIGAPQKTVFDAASTAPNVLVTDTLNPYPDSLFSSVSFYIPPSLLNDGAIVAVQWNQKLDLDTNKDVGLVEISVDSGANWINAFDFPEVYNFYGFATGSVTNFPPYGDCFTGTDTVWRNVWLCFNYSVAWLYDNLQVRYTIVSDSIETGQDGWMIDNVYLQPTWFHPVTEQSKPGNFRVYPTVSDQVFHVELLNLSPDFIIRSAVLLNMQGQTVREITLSERTETVDVSGLPAGRYFLKIETSEKKEIHPIVVGR